MVVKFCPHCNQSYIVSFDTTDYVHTCNSGNLALDQEDVVVTGNWSDDRGSGVVPAQQVMRQGGENKLQGTRAGNEGMDAGLFTRRGKRATTHRQRQHFEFINLSKKGLD